MISVARARRYQIFGVVSQSDAHRVDGQARHVRSFPTLGCESKAMIADKKSIICAPWTSKREADVARGLTCSNRVQARREEAAGGAACLRGGLGSGPVQARPASWLVACLRNHLFLFWRCASCLAVAGRGSWLRMSHRATCANAKLGTLGSTASLFQIYFLFPLYISW